MANHKVNSSIKYTCMNMWVIICNQEVMIAMQLPTHTVVAIYIQECAQLAVT